MRSFSLPALVLVIACGPSPQLDEKDCRFRLHPSQQLGVTVRCGVLQTFAEHDTGGELSITVPYVLFKHSDEPSEHLQVQLAGGPGQSWADLGVEDMVSNSDLPYDSVLIEQRGAGLSQPRLDCPKATAGETDVAYVERCARELTARGIPLSAFNTVELAHDVLELQRLLGYKTIVLNGVSYGTAWALEVMRQAPKQVAGALLDSVVSPAIAPLARDASAKQEALNNLFEACERDADCAKAGNLEASLYASLPRLDQADSPQAVVDGEVLTGQRALHEVLRWLEESPADAAQFIRSLEPSRTRDDATALRTYSEGTKITLGQYFSVMCSDNQFVTDEQLAQDTLNVGAELRPYLPNAAEAMALCRVWPFKQRQSLPTVSSAIPTLLLAGSVDWRTPVSWARAAAQTLSNATLVEVPSAGHDVGSRGGYCVRQIESFFLDTFSPGSTTCAKDERPLFYAAVRDAKPTLARRAGLTERLPLWPRPKH